MPSGESITNNNRQLKVIPKTRKLTGIALFAALAVILNLTLKIPAPYAPFLYYEVWEIPIVVAFLVFGTWVGISVSVINYLALQAIFPGALATGPLYNLAAILLTLLGVGASHKALQRARKGIVGITIGATLLAILTRVVGMTFVNAAFLPFPPPIGFSIPPAALPPVLGLIAIFNTTVVLYTVPIAYSIVDAISRKYLLPLSYSVPKAAAQPITTAATTAIVE
jgi:riboflavin transporter FmnP